MNIHRPNSTQPINAFTAIELLIVLAVMAVLVTLQLPAVANARKNAQTVQCLSNQKQVVMAWLMYAEANRGNFAPNLGTPSQANDLTTPGWVKGWLDYNSTDANTNPWYLTNRSLALLASYISSPRVFKCPADTSCSGGLTGLPRIRSISMNAAIRAGTELYMDNLGTNHFLTYGKLSSLTNPAPASLFVTIEEHADSINDGAFAFKMPITGAQTTWVDVPAVYHGNCCVLSFADGHAEPHTWQNPNRIPPISYVVFKQSLGFYMYDPDIQWLAKHTSAYKDGRSFPY